ncbi:hypothetical protein [Neptunicoccus cionae]|uniref:hypothetical protein n=1 Tax=Neptunicoccus cionae TaxID=2035344 RepID=UPI000C7575A1|nr:hypothetical protein [Amylibacter cionae]PLS23192.1 hypothetical protein C0U40_03390 [Amylibacter cionae]
MFRSFSRITGLPLPAHGALAVFSIFWFQWTKGKLDASYAASKHPVDYMTGQTSFSGETIKGYYAIMSEAGTLDIYTRTQLIDFAFILGFLGIGLFVCTLLARLGREGSLGRKAGVLAGLSFVLGGISDMIENGWSFVMLVNPTGFADWLALPYSAFAVLKFGLITAGMALLLISVLTSATGRVLGKANIG